MNRPELQQVLDQIRSDLPPGEVSWSGSPWAWLLHNGPVTKNRIGRELALQWTKALGLTVSEGNGGTFGHHLLVNDTRVAVHFATLGKEGDFRFSALREPEMGIDWILLIGVEPKRVRLWRMHPSDTRDLPTFSGDVEGIHSLTFDPEKVPSHLRLYDEVTA